MDEVLAIAKDIADAPPGAVAETRRLMEHGRTHTLEEAFAEEGRTLATRYGSEENVQAVMAFLAARKK
jgi:enoyl-CoA hydratase/carnithine racemase